MKSKWSRLEAITGAESRVKRLAEDIVTHYEERQEAMFGKSQNGTRMMTIKLTTTILVGREVLSVSLQLFDMSFRNLIRVAFFILCGLSFQAIRRKIANKIVLTLKLTLMLL